MPPRSKRVYCFGSVCYSVILSFCNSVWIFYLVNTFWTVSARALTFHRVFLLTIPFQGYHHFYPVTLTLEFDLLFENLTLFVTFEQWVRELWYFTCAFLGTRHWVPFFFTLCLWSWSKTYSLKTLTLQLLWNSECHSFQISRK